MCAFAIAAAIALLLRLPSFGELPRGLNRDEAALAYNAYSLLKTGTDEHQRRWPVSIESFGDQKLPGYVYTLIPFIAVGGLNPITTRLPSLLASLVVITAVGAIAHELLPRRASPRERQLFTLGAMLLIAISPWDNHFARVAYEAHLAMALFLTGLAAWIRAQRPAHSGAWTLLSATCFALTLMTYHSYHVLTPLFVLALFVSSPVKSMNRSSIFAGIIIGTLTVTLLIFGGVLGSNQVKIAGISPFGKERLLDRMFVLRQAFPGTTPLEKLWSNQPLEALDTLGRNLTETLASDFLFTTTTDHHVHNLSGIGNLHRFLAPFLVAGILALWELRKQRPTRWLVAWTLLALLPASLTISPQHTVRLSPVFPALELIAALGIWFVWKQLASRWRRPYLIAVVLLAVFATSRWWVEYRVLAPAKDRSWSHERFQLLGQTLAQYALQADEVITQSPADSPYIWYLMASHYEPRQLGATIEYYPKDKEGFLHVKRVGNVFFETIQWDDLEARAKDRKLILIFRPSEVPEEVRQSGNLRWKDTLKDSSQTAVYEVWEMGI